jgi:hypothetical protein
MTLVILKGEKKLFFFPLSKDYFPLTVSRPSVNFLPFQLDFLAPFLSVNFALKLLLTNCPLLCGA